MEWLNTLTSDPNFWVMLSTVLCFGFIANKAWRPILAGLDGRSEMIRNRLDEAEALRLEAKALVEEYKKKSAEAMNEAEEIIRNAERRAEQMRIQMEKELHETIARQEINAKNRISRLEEEAFRTVKSALIDAALAQVKTEAANDSVAKPNIDQSLTDIKSVLQQRQS